MEPLEIAVMRGKLKLTQDEFCQLVGVHTLTISKWERGLLQPRGFQKRLLNIINQVSNDKWFQTRKLDDILYYNGPLKALYYILDYYYKVIEEKKENVENEPSISSKF